MKGDEVSARGGVTAARYLELLEEYLPTILGFDSIFMQDNAPIHKAYIVMKWFQDMGVELSDVTNQRSRDDHVSLSESSGH
jgi:hypothetical protein